MLFAGHLIFVAFTAASPDCWNQIAPGMHTCTVHSKVRAPVGDGRIVVVRVDPAKWAFTLLSLGDASNSKKDAARGWAQRNGLVLATNAGMFETDFRTHVGYMASPTRVNSDRINHYLSVVAFDPRQPTKRPAFRIFDLDQPGITIPAIRKDYGSVVQNLRLVKKPGRNRWPQQPKRWSEAALGEDKQGRALFVFSRTPFSMRDLNLTLLRSKIGLVALQHLEGGPEAQLYVDVPGTKFELFGSFETDFRDDDSNNEPWPIPNVIGVAPRPPQ